MDMRIYKTFRKCAIATDEMTKFQVEMHKSYIFTRGARDAGDAHRVRDADDVHVLHILRA